MHKDKLLQGQWFSTKRTQHRLLEKESPSGVWPTYIPLGSKLRPKGPSSHSNLFFFDSAERKKKDIIVISSQINKQNYRTNGHQQV